MDIQFDFSLYDSAHFLFAKSGVFGHKQYSYWLFIGKMKNAFRIYQMGVIIISNNKNILKNSFMIQVTNNENLWKHALCDCSPVVANPKAYVSEEIISRTGQFCERNPIEPKLVYF